VEAAKKKAEWIYPGLACHRQSFNSKWLILSNMAEISHPKTCNFSSPPLFKYTEDLESFKDQVERSIPKGSGGDYAVSQIFGARDSADGAAGLFAGAG
jgi:hypothetical protein